MKSSLTFKKILFDCFTGRDNETFDIGRILWALSVIIFLALAVWDVPMTHDFNPLDFGGGLGAVLAAGGAAIGLKSKTEPDK